MDLTVVTGIEILEVKVGMGMSGAALVIEMLDVMGMLLSSGHLVLKTMGFKPLVALLRHQCNARRLVRLSLEGPLLDLVVVVHKIHCMTLGMTRIRGEDAPKIATRVNHPTTPYIRPATRSDPRRRGPLAHMPRAWRVMVT